MKALLNVLYARPARSNAGKGTSGNNTPLYIIENERPDELSPWQNLLIFQRGRFIHSRLFRPPADMSGDGGAFVYSTQEN